MTRECKSRRADPAAPALATIRQFWLALDRRE